MPKKLLVLCLSASLWLQGFDIKIFNKTNAFELGAELIKFPFGIHQIDSDGLNAVSAIVGIHGSNSEGYEWIYPLSKLDNDTNSIYFYRWNDQQCANKQSNTLLQAIEQTILDHPHLKEIKILAHSYGGLLLLHTLEDLNLLIRKMDRAMEIEVH